MSQIALDGASPAVRSIGPVDCAVVTPTSATAARARSPLWLMGREV
jgi:hypothetical protein